MGAAEGHIGLSSLPASRCGRRASAGPVAGRRRSGSRLSDRIVQCPVNLDDSIIYRESLRKHSAKVFLCRISLDVTGSFTPVFEFVNFSLPCTVKSLFPKSVLLGLLQWPRKIASSSTPIQVSIAGRGSNPRISMLTSCRDRSRRCAGDFTGVLVLASRPRGSHAVRVTRQCPRAKVFMKRHRQYLKSN